jgi:hypothetical protein
MGAVLFAAQPSGMTLHQSVFDALAQPKLEIAVALKAADDQHIAAFRHEGVGNASPAPEPSGVGEVIGSVSSRGDGIGFSAHLLRVGIVDGLRKPVA